MGCQNSKICLTVPRAQEPKIQVFAAQLNISDEVGSPSGDSANKPTTSVVLKSENNDQENEKNVAKDKQSSSKSKCLKAKWISTPQLSGSTEQKLVNLSQDGCTSVDLTQQLRSKLSLHHSTLDHLRQKLGARRNILTSSRGTLKPLRLTQDRSNCLQATSDCCSKQQNQFFDLISPVRQTPVGLNETDICPGSDSVLAHRFFSTRVIKPIETPSLKAIISKDGQVNKQPVPQKRRTRSKSPVKSKNSLQPTDGTADTAQPGTASRPHSSSRQAEKHRRTSSSGNLWFRPET